MPEIPKSAREHLAKQPPAGPHPSPDLLNGYVEQALTPAENTQVLAHLSTCADCREVVFLASGAAEAEMQPERAAAAQPATTLDRAPVGMLARGAVSTGTAKAKPPRLWWKWAVPLAALVIVGSAALIERDRFSGLSNRPMEMARVNREAPAIQGAPASPPATRPEPTAKTPLASEDAEVRPNAFAFNQPEKQMMPATRAYDKKKEAAQPTIAGSRKDAPNRKMLESQLAGNLATPAANAVSAAESKAATPPPPANSTTVEVTSAAPLVQADQADLSTNVSQGAKTDSLAKSSLVANDQAASGIAAAMPMARQKAAGSRWRIGSDGRLERSTGAGTWTQKLASEAVTFRAVATVGSEVWAGGNGGALFHSSDSGDQFNKVVLAANGQTERGAIVSIHFDTAQQGSVTSDSGATWTTTDGGRSWSRQ